MSTLKIYRASAGSGKTYTLTREYINLLFQKEADYQHILAVTFTNKATAEMKGRIIKSLYELWKTDLHKEWMAELSGFVGSEELVRYRAEKILHLLLHDFSRFSISTIDSYFQKIIRSFIQELGLFSGYKTELNSTKILQLAVDRLVMALGQPDKKELREWLISFSYEKMESGKTWNVAGELMQLGREVNAEKFQGFHASFIQKLNDKKLLDEFKKELYQITDTFKEAIQTYGKSLMKILQSNQLTWDDFYMGSKTPFKAFERMAAFEKWETMEKLRPYLNDADTWPRKTDKNAIARVQQAYHQGANALLTEALSFCDNHLMLYNTASIILKNFNSLAILNDIANEMDAICKEEGIFLLSNSNRLLNRIIDSNDSPFIYEKSGTRYKHFMIDEFQDTSTLQWNNFRPLIENSLASDDYSLLVGDVKQSIYRWRNSDWKLLASQVKEDFMHLGVDEKNLDTNWRSSERIIAFNNALFEQAAALLQNDFNNDITHLEPQVTARWYNRILQAYHDVHQKVSPGKIHSGGLVHVEFIDCKLNDEFQDIALQKAIEKVEEIISKGYSFKDICFLVRKTAEARLVTNALLSGKYASARYPVVSNEALVLGSAIGVLQVVNQLRHILNPDNSLNMAYIQLYQTLLEQTEISLVDADLLHHDIETQAIKELKGLPLIDLVQKLVQDLPPARHQTEGVFLQAFVDAAIEYVQNESADLASFIEWWETDGQMRAVSVPEDQDAIRVMTIHKSKGLEFETVIMPFINWNLEDTRHNSVLWCEDPFNRLDYLPVQFDKKLLESSFSNDYLEEHLHSYVDNLNMLYVAFTRACTGLYCFGRTPGKSLSRVDELLYLALSNPMTQQKMSATLDTANQAELWKNNQLTLGILPIKAHIEKPTDHAIPEFATWPLPVMQSWPYSDRVAIFMESEGFMDPNIQLQINKGKRMHRLFELIATADDVERAIRQMVQEGMITRGEAADLQQQVIDLIGDSEVKDWFKHEVKIMNERSLLSSRGIFRPDRVVEDGTTLKIIDYKFGEVHSKAHERQMSNYMNLAAQMNYEKVEGYLWYVNEGKVIKVAPSHPTLF